MTHISSIGAGIYSMVDMSFETLSTTTPVPATFAVGTTANNTNWAWLFQTRFDLGSPTSGTGAFRALPQVREFPQMGTPPNIVNVPVYGSKISRQVQGQADAPTFEVTINYVPSDWDPVVANNKLGSFVGNGVQYAWRFSLLNSLPAGYGSYVSGATGLGSVANSQYFWLGKMEALQISPQLTDANQATVTVSIQSDFVGPYTTT